MAVGFWPPRACGHDAQKLPDAILANFANSSIRCPPDQMYLLTGALRAGRRRRGPVDDDPVRRVVVPTDVLRRGGNRCDHPIRRTSTRRSR